MDYEQKYKEALERARESHDKSNGFIKKEWIETIFPKLKESEDEKIREEIIKNIRQDIEIECTLSEDEGNRWIAWLEKQGEKSDYNPYKATIESIAAMVEKYANGDLRDFYDNIKVKCKDAMEYDNTWNKKQGEQKPYIGDADTMRKNLVKQSKQKPAVKIEPKFKAGDWIVNNHGKVNQVFTTNYRDEYIVLDDGSYFNRSECDNYRLWTIDDVMDGDVLASINGAIFINAGSSSSKKRVTLDCYCYLSVQSEFCIEEHKTGSWFYKNDIKPATKEQCELLFSKMKEEGYEWDAEKKELKKIDGYCKEHCKGFQETGKCYADGECKAKRDSERSNIVERLTAFAVHLQKRGAFRDDLCMDFEHEAQSFIELQNNKEL